jgi:hypothetical protein
MRGVSAMRDFSFSGSADVVVGTLLLVVTMMGIIVSVV